MCLFLPFVLDTHRLSLHRQKKKKNILPSLSYLLPFHSFNENLSLSLSLIRFIIKINNARLAFLVENEKILRDFRATGYRFNYRKKTYLLFIPAGRWRRFYDDALEKGVKCLDGRKIGENLILASNRSYRTRV